MAREILFAEPVFARWAFDRWVGLVTRHPDHSNALGLLCLWLESRNVTARIVEPWHHDIAIPSDGFGTGTFNGSTKSLLRLSTSI